MNDKQRFSILEGINGPIKRIMNVQIFSPTLDVILEEPDLNKSMKRKKNHKKTTKNFKKIKYTCEP